jgi:hypothetical protein
MTQAISPTSVVMAEAIAILDAIDRAALRYSHEDIMEAAKLVEQRRLNFNMARIADALDRH